MRGVRGSRDLERGMTGPAALAMAAAVGVVTMAGPAPREWRDYAGGPDSYATFTGWAA